MNIKTTLVLLIVLVVFGAVLLFVNRDGGTRPDTAAAGEKRLFNVQTQDVTKVSVTPAEGEPMVLEKSGAEWRLTRPVAAPAETWAVDSLVRDLVGLASRGQIDLTGENADATGLAKPRYVVEFAAKDGKTSKLKVGSRSSIGDNLYVQLDGEAKATVVAAALAEQLEKPVASFRQSKLVNVGSSDIKQIEIAKPDSKIILQKSGNDWQIVEPEKMPAESSEVSEIASAISFLSASEFVTSEAEVLPALLPSKSPKLSVWFTTQAPTTQPAAQPATRPAGTTITFGGYDSITKKNLYVSVSEPATLAKVSASMMDSFNKKPMELRDRRVLDIDPTLVSRLSIVTDKPSTTQPTTMPASHAELLVERKKEAVVVGAAAPAGGPTTQPSVQPVTAPTTAPVAATTQPTTAPALPPSNWALKSSPGGDASQAKVESVLQKLHPLRVEKYLAPSAAATQPSATYTVEITVEAGGGAKTVTHQIRLIDPGQDKPLIGQYNNLAFEVPRTLVEGFGDDFANKP